MVAVPDWDAATAWTRNSKASLRSGRFKMFQFLLIGPQHHNTLHLAPLVNCNRAAPARQ